MGALSVGRDLEGSAEPALLFGSYRYLLAAQVLPLIQGNQDKSCEGYVCFRASVATLWMQDHTHDPPSVLERLSPTSPV